MSLQPTLPPEQAPSEIEKAFIEEEPPGLWPANQDSNYGLHRKILCDILTDVAAQLDLLLNEKFLETTNQFIEAHEEELGLTLNPSNITLAQRRAALFARKKRGPFTNSLRNQVIESFVQGALTGGSPATFGTSGISFTASGIPLYSGLSGDPKDYYSVIENVEGFSYSVVIDSRVNPDLVGLTRELTRITPAGISFTITGGSGASIIQKSGGAKSAGKFGGTHGNPNIPKAGGAISHGVGGATRNIPGGTYGTATYGTAVYGG